MKKNLALKITFILLCVVIAVLFISTLFSTDKNPNVNQNEIVNTNTSPMLTQKVDNGPTEENLLVENKVEIANDGDFVKSEVSYLYRFIERYSYSWIYTLNNDKGDLKQFFGDGANEMLIYNKELDDIGLLKADNKTGVILSNSVEKLTFDPILGHYWVIIGVSDQITDGDGRSYLRNYKISFEIIESGADYEIITLSREEIK